MLNEQKKVLKSSQPTSQVQIQKIKPDNAVGMPEIHGFCDAKEKAYGSAMFLCWKLDDGSYTCVQLMVKAFVSLLNGEVNTVLGVNGLSRALMVIPIM